MYKKELIHRTVCEFNRIICSLKLKVEIAHCRQTNEEIGDGVYACRGGDSKRPGQHIGSNGRYHRFTLDGSISILCMPIVWITLGPCHGLSGFDGFC